MKSVAVLFARSDSVYKSIPDCDVYDEQRDATTYTGNLPVIAHPPCRGWGRLRTFSKHQVSELDLAHFAVAQVRRCGGVLEHPASSLLWAAALLPAPGHRDQFGGFTFPVLQSDFGHRAPKKTWLYACGIEPAQLPTLPLVLGHAFGRVELMARKEREATPVDLAVWLVSLASKSTINGRAISPEGARACM